MKHKLPDIPALLSSSSNVLVGFASAQSIAYLIALGGNDFAKNVGKEKVVSIVSWICIPSCIFYCFCVIWCYYRIISWYKTLNYEDCHMTEIKKAQQGILVCRIIILVFFAFVTGFLPGLYIN